jgi:hypothetical protein
MRDVIGARPSRVRNLGRVDGAMTKVVNLNLARKRTRRDAEEQRAQQNRLLHGRTKAEKKLNQAQSEAARRHLDSHHIKSGDDA